jgi:hypothetical protein
MGPMSGTTGLDASLPGAGEVAAIVAVAGLVIAFGGWLWWRHRQARRPSIPAWRLLPPPTPRLLAAGLVWLALLAALYPLAVLVLPGHGWQLRLGVGLAAFVGLGFAAGLSLGPAHGWWRALGVAGLGTGWFLLITVALFESQADAGSGCTGVNSCDTAYGMGAVVVAAMAAVPLLAGVLAGKGFRMLAAGRRPAEG